MEFKEESSTGHESSSDVTDADALLVMNANQQPGNKSTIQRWTRIGSIRESGRVGSGRG